jgi:hypothetical protein
MIEKPSAEMIAAHERALAENRPVGYRELHAIHGARSEVIAQEFGTLKKRIHELESRTANFRYVGVYRQDIAYCVGNFATHDGSLWHCNADNTTETPGTGAAWTLCVKRGRSDRR